MPVKWDHENQSKFSQLEKNAECVCVETQQTQNISFLMQS